MTTTREDIRRWIEEGRNNGATHIIVVCDWYDSHDYPVYVRPDYDVYERESEIIDDGDQVMEVYWIEPAADVEKQLAAGRQFTYSEHHSSIDPRQV